MRTKRSTKLIADFEDGYAKGWAYNVRPCFRDQLDIRLTERVIKGKAQRVWTQGRNFCFEVGDILYNTPLAYRDWDSAIAKSGFRYVKVTDAKPPEDPDSVDGVGYVRFGIHMVSHRGRHVLLGSFLMPQHAFVEYLRTGDLEGYEPEAKGLSDDFTERKPRKTPFGETARITDIRRSIERLYGILFGISCDEVINDLEVQALKSWLSLHPNLRLNQPFYSVRQVVEKQDPDHEGLLECCRCFKNAEFVVPRNNSIIRRFHGIAQGISCDNEINENELSAVNRWVGKYAQPVRYEWPISEFLELASRYQPGARERDMLDFCRKFTEVKIADPTPREQAPAFMRSGAPIVEPLQGVTDHISEIVFEGRSFCFTGVSKEYSRSELHKIVEKAGGWVLKTVSSSLDYLVVCGQGNPNWGYSTYGRKISEAVEFNRIPDPHGIRKKIVIVDEGRFFQEMNRQHPSTV
jgi:hypothetical protein